MRSLELEFAEKHPRMARPSSHLAFKMACTMKNTASDALSDHLAESYPDSKCADFRYGLPTAAGTSRSSRYFPTIARKGFRYGSTLYTRTSAV